MLRRIIRTTIAVTFMTALIANGTLPTVPLITPGIHHAIDTAKNLTERTPRLTDTNTPGTVRWHLTQLPVTPEHTNGYNRDHYPHWTTDPRGCTTRDRILTRDNTTKTRHQTGCRPTQGTWTPWYDNTSHHSPNTLDIDHIVPLAEAHRSGAHTWNTRRRTRFANAPHNLTATTRTTNQAKSDHDPTHWLPTTTSRCRYLNTWVAVKSHWNLTIDHDEKRALTKLAATCPNEPLPRRRHTP